MFFTWSMPCTKHAKPELNSTDLLKEFTAEILK